VRSFQLVPPQDLLERVDGVERGLALGRRLGVAGWGAFTVSAVSLVASIATSKSAAAVGSFGWPFLVAVIAAALGLLLVNWTRFWLKASRAPFRYTYSLAAFEPIGRSVEHPRIDWHQSERGVEPTRVEEGAALDWLVQDLSERLSRRIGRLSLLDERYSGTTKQPEAHLHIGGSFGVRQNIRGEWMIEVLPWIRLGAPGSPATVAHLVRFTLGPDRRLGPEAYQKLLERIYFSIASHLYRQIRDDVKRKIELLPKRFFRANAYFFEAADYVSSNTLDAYDQARELYEEVLHLYDPSWWPRSPSRLRRKLNVFNGKRIEFGLAWRKGAAKVWPRFGAVELMIARAEVGYANTVLYRRSLAGMSGQRLNAVFEARPVAQSALKRLNDVPEDTPGQLATHFEALVTLAATYAALGSRAQSETHLRDARTLNPARAEQDARYLHVRGQLVGPRRAIHDLRRAVELNPSFEMAQFDLAGALEMVWRSRAALERDVAETVRDEYDRVLTLNPGNISAWANLGYLDWLLQDFAGAERAFERGREYKEIKRETFVSELDYGLARIAAEQGDFKTAYQRYIDAVSARFAQGISHDPSDYTTYHFARITRTIVRRFETYRERVEASWQSFRNTNPDNPSPRVRDAVYAFVLNDYAEACFNYFLRSGNNRFLNEARAALEQAENELSARYPMVQFNLHRVAWWDGDGATAEGRKPYIERAVELQPDWVDGMLERAVWYREIALRGRAEASALSAQAEQLNKDAAKRRKEARAREKEAKPFDSRAPAQDDLWTLLVSSPQTTASDRPVGPGASPVIEMGTAQAGPTQAIPSAPPEYELPMPLAGQTVAIETAVSQLEGEGADLERQAATLDQQAAAALADATEREVEAAEIVRALLPHAWLWKGDGDVVTLDVEALKDKEYAQKRKWQRELDDLHVRALVMWARLGTAGDETERADVLEFVRERFLPDDSDVLIEGRALAALRTAYTEPLRSVVTGWIENEHAWWSLRWITAEDDLFDRDKAAKILRHVASTDQTLPDSLCLWLGSELESVDLPDEATACYRRVATSHLADAAVLFDLSARLRDRDDLESALEVLRRAEKVDRADGYKSYPASAYRREAARVLWKLARYRAATEELAGIDNRELGSSWREGVIRELIEDGELTAAEGYRLLKNWLGRVLTVHRNDGPIRRDAASALLRLTLQRYHPLVRRSREPRMAAELADVMTPSVSPIILEADSSFFPSGEQTPQVRRILDPNAGDGIAMCTRVEARTGVPIPPIRILSTTGLGAGRYSILLEGVPLATGTLGSEPLFCHDDEAARRHRVQGRPGRDPLTGFEGLWIVDDKRLPSSVETWDQYEYMVRHLEAVVLRNVDRFLSMQQGESLLRAASPELAADEAPHTRLVEALRSLVREGVPLTEAVPVIVELTEDYGHDPPLGPLVDAARAALRASIPGADGSRPLVAVRPEIEDAIAVWADRGNGNGALAMPGMTVEVVRRLLAEQLATQDPQAALVVRMRGLRSFVRRICEIDHPAVPVVAYTELPEDLRFVIREPAATT
jgi:tetratricopeptide (TPR) repeat protein